MYLNSCGIVAVAAKENGQIAVSRRKEKNDEDYYRNNGNEAGAGVHTLSSVLQSIEPVSYTHLDVYKRQHQRQCFFFPGGRKAGI